MAWEDDFVERAEQQHGLLARFHVAGLGWTTGEWRNARRNGRWEALGLRVIRLRGTVTSPEQRALAAVLDASPGAMLHGTTALGFVGMRGYDMKELLVARPRGITGKPATLGILHHLRAVRPHHVMVLRGVPIERPLRAIWVEAAKLANPALFEVGVERIGKLLDAAHRKRLVTWAELHEMVGDIHERGGQARRSCENSHALVSLARASRRASSRTASRRS